MVISQKKETCLPMFATELEFDYPFAMKRFLFSIAVILIILTSCTVTEDLTINTDGSGKSYSDINVEQFFVDVLEDFSDFLPESDQTIMDSAVSGYAGSLGNIESIENAEWEKTGENQYILSFSYKSLDELLKDFNADSQTLLDITGNSISFHLDIESYAELKEIIPFLSDPNFEVYGPEYNQGMSEDDYLDMIYFLLGEDGPDAIRNGLISVTMNVPGTLTEVTGGEKLDDNSVRFSFPIIDFLLLNEPIEFSASWE